VARREGSFRPSIMGADFLLWVPRVIGATVSRPEMISTNFIISLISAKCWSHLNFCKIPHFARCTERQIADLFNSIYSNLVRVSTSS
jgi:hypothetical protein